MICIKVRSRSIDIYDLITWFITYSFLGWVYETTFCSLIEGHFVNRGFLYGPILPIYGSCIVFAIVLLYDKKFSKPMLFILCSLMASAFEYTTSFWMELIFNKRWWDYSNELLNINGRVCLGASIVFGLFGVFILCRLHPALEKILDYLYTRLSKKSAAVIMFVFSIDLLGSFLMIK